MRVLLVTYYFPPAGGGGVQRVLGWCRYLPQHGVEVTVAAPAEPRWVDEDTTLVVPPDTRVVRTPDPSPPAVIPRDALAQVGGLRKLMRRVALQPRRLAVPDIHRRWRRPAVRAILHEAARVSGERGDGRPAWDVVVSSSPPETTHLVARDVARALGVPWVADYRDSWLDLPHLRLDRLDVRAKHAANRRLAVATMRDAGAAVTVSEPLAADLRQRHPGLDVHVIENGVDFGQVQRAAARAAGFRDAGKFVLTYTGNFFGRQSPATFLDGLDQAIAVQPELRDELAVRFVGGLRPVDTARIEASEALTAIVEMCGFLRHDDVLAQQRAADLLMLYVAPGRGSAGVFTGKVFEYVASRRPVLALAPADNVAAELLRRSGQVAAPAGALVDPENVDEIASAVLEAWRAWRAGGGPAGAQSADVSVADDVLRSIDRARGAHELHDMLAALSQSQLLQRHEGPRDGEPLV